MYISINKDRIVTAVSDYPLAIFGETQREILGDSTKLKSLIGERLPHKYLRVEDYVVKPHSEMRVAVVCNWQTKCGISTYSKYLVDSITPLVKEIKIFSEFSPSTTGPDGPEVERCWNRGECLVPLANKILDWNPDFVIIQHEYGIFPNLFYFMQFMQLLENTPYAVTLHSVYEHLDKIVYANAIKNIVVHTEQGKQILLRHGYNSEITVIPHGCVRFNDVQEIWNLCHNPYTILQFGFGFQYKGVDRALDAIAHLKATDKKFANIFYMYLLSENEHTKNVHNEYYKQLMNKVRELGLDHNVAILRKFQTDQMLNLYLRLAKLAIFPYINNPQNTVYTVCL
jgi:glycosyltransferase involved in cell wall biosynthesis